MVTQHNPKIDGGGVIDSTVLSYTRHKRVLMLGGEGARPEHRQSLLGHLRIAQLEWEMPGRSAGSGAYTKIADSLRPGKFDLFLCLIRFIGHHGMEVVKAARAAGIPTVLVPGGYSVHSIAHAIREQLARDVAPPPAAAAPTAVLLDRPPNKPTSVERRIESTRWVHEHPTLGFGHFKEAFPERDLDSAWFYAQKRKLGQPPPAPEPAPPPPPPPTIPQEAIMPDATPARIGRAPSADALRIRTYLEKLSLDAVKALDAGEYKRKTGHKVQAFTFRSERKRRLNLLQGRAAYSHNQPKEKKMRGSKKPQLEERRGTLMELLARVELKEFEGLPIGKLKELALAIAKQMHPRGGEAQIVVLAEPLAFEIRVPG